MRTNTESERLFERLCMENAIPYERVAQGAMRTPDYELRPKGVRVIVEVKELKPSPSDRAYAAQIEATGFATAREEPGRRVRKIIDSAYGQLKERAQDCPGIVVAFNAIAVKRHMFLTTYDVMVGMYGLELAHVSVPKDPLKESYVSQVSFGPKKKVTETQSRSLSAFAVMYDHEGISLFVYHNRYACRPLDPAILKAEKIKHFAVVDPGNDWGTWREIST